MKLLSVIAVVITIALPSATFAQSDDWSSWTSIGNELSVSYKQLGRDTWTWKFRNDGTRTLLHLEFEYSDTQGDHKDIFPGTLKPGAVLGGFAAFTASSRPSRIRVLTISREGDSDARSAGSPHAVGTGTRAGERNDAAPKPRDEAERIRDAVAARNAATQRTSDAITSAGRQITELLTSKTQVNDPKTTGEVPPVSVQVDEDRDLNVPMDTRARIDGCNRGDAGLCVDAGSDFEDGKGLPTDFPRAAKYYSRGCEGGNDLGCTSLASLYYHGRGVSLNPERAVELFKKTCDNGFALGCHMLGALYNDDKSLVPDRAQAVIYYERACTLGRAGACTEAGWMYENGRGVSRDLVRAASFYQKACDAGNLDGCNQRRRLPQ